VPNDAPPRLLRVRHTTTYHYDRPVERSSHLFHLRPFHDRRQAVLEHNTTVETDPPNEIVGVEYEDGFGNEAGRFVLETPYQMLRVTGDTLVRLTPGDPFDFELHPKRPTVPLNWMPRERLVLGPYLQSEELPDTQVEELFEYAMSFVRAADDDLMEALFAINLAIFRDFEYVPGSTSLSTTPYDIFESRRGVCQDFANLFITLARLIRVPARYVCGYLYTGNADNPQAAGSRAPSDATHAWVQLYLPNIGWKGFDPTNGVLPKMDHVRLAVGRFWRDTAPLEGTIFGEPVKETLEAAVEVIDETKQAAA
jgi:transglutaminase-like putative cysteine protease